MNKFISKFSWMIQTPKGFKKLNPYNTWILNSYYNSNLDTCILNIDNQKVKISFNNMLFNNLNDGYIGVIKKQ